MNGVALAAERPAVRTPADTGRSCFHCGLDVPADLDLTVTRGDAELPVCCHGCAAAVHFLEHAGLDAYYRFREEPTGVPARADDDTAPAWSDPRLAERYISHDADGDRIILALDGMRCAACAWLLETGLSELDGIRDLNVDPGSARLDVGWDPQRSDLERIIARVRHLGFDAVPAHEDDELRLHARQRRRSLRAVGISGIVAMQVMMLAAADYAGMLGPEGSEMATGYRGLVLWAQMVLTSVSVLLCTGTFFGGALRALRRRHITMDVPVALAIGIAWTASMAALFTGAAADGDHVYFDSVAMFVFLLLLGRHFELGIRHRFARSDRSLGDLLPALARRRGNDGSWSEVPTDCLEPGDRIRVRAGESIPADGRILSGRGHLDRAVLTGESEPVAIAQGSAVDAGTRNLDAVLELEVTRAVDDSAVAGIPALLRRARSGRARTVHLADRVATVFLSVVLVAAAITGGIWLQIDPDRALAVVLATLIVTCPCALSLATPTAVTAAATRLRRHGVLLGDPDALESVADCTEVCLDKTGTVTRPDDRSLQLVETAPGIDPQQARDRVAALEADIDHPLARAARAELGAPLRPATDVRSLAAIGVEGRINGEHYRFGRPDACGGDGEGLVLARIEDGEPRFLARFEIREELAADAEATLADLRVLGLPMSLLSGDAPERVATVARSLGIDDWRGGASPEDKLEWLEQRRGTGARILYVGDGINDAPALGGASAAVAVGSASDFARHAADVVLIEPGLAPLGDLVRVARAMRRRIRMNLGWAFGYNLIALPLAMSGVLSPWMAALGMSASSLVVMAGSMSLLSIREGH